MIPVLNNHNPTPTNRETSCGFWKYNDKEDPKLVEFLVLYFLSSVPQSFFYLLQNAF